MWLSNFLVYLIWFKSHSKYIKIYNIRFINYRGVWKVCFYQTIEILFKKVEYVECIKAVKMITILGLPGGAVVKNPPANAGDTGSSPGPERSHMPRSN